MSTPQSSIVYNAAESRASSLRAAGISTYIFAVIAVFLRFLSRRLRKTSWWLDDWLLLCSLVWFNIYGTFSADKKFQVPATAFLIDILIWIPDGLGGHYVFFGPQVLYNFNKHLFVGEITYTLVLVLAKYGILALYWRIFNYSSMRVPVLVTVGVVTAWGVAVIVTSCLQCIPTQGFWDRSINASCHVDTNKFFMGVTITNILTDGWLLSLPIPFIFKLQTSTWQKAGLSGMFLLGGFVTIASILRLVSVVQEDPNDPDVTWTFAVVTVWSLVEVNLAIVSANLPCMTPIYSALLKRTFTSAVDNLKTLTYKHRRTAGDIECGHRTIHSKSANRFQWSFRVPGKKSSQYDTLDEENSIPLRVIQN